MAGYPRVIGYYPGVGGYVAGVDAHPMALPPSPMAPAGVVPAMMHPGMPGHPGFAHPGHPGAFGHGHPGYGYGHPGVPYPQHHHHHPYAEMPAPIVAPVQQPPWRHMVAPGSPPLGEGHVPIPLNAETFGGSWGNVTAGGAAAGNVITFSSRPQKPFKLSRLLIRATKSGTTAIGNLVGQVYIGSDLQQGDVGNIDLESLGAANAFDTWLSFKQADPGVWIRVQATLTAFPTGTDFESYTITAIGHYFH